MSTRRSFSSISMSGTSSRNGVTFERGEGGLALALGVERRDAHQAVHAVLGAQAPVGVAAADQERGRGDAGLGPGRHLVELDVEAAALGPAQVHAQQHVGPVLGVGPALAGLDLADGVGLVVLAGEQRAQLELVEVGAPARRSPPPISGSTESSASSRAELVAASRRRRCAPASASYSSRSSLAAGQLAVDLAGQVGVVPEVRARRPRSRAGAGRAAARRCAGRPAPRRGAAAGRPGRR